ncbi:MAG: alkyl hydroperoxide reductase subunit F [Bdellovibrionota bacterium]
MLDNNMIDQLKEVFANLENQIDLVYDSSDHPKQEELIEMLQDVAKASSFLNVRESGIKNKYPHFCLYYKGVKNGIEFIGVPGGHEFSSLVLAILNSDKKGKLPDQTLIERIARIKGPIELKTYISLSCENCPDVVQSLNLMAILHPEFSHTMVDGGIAQDDIEQYNIQGVPTTLAAAEIISSGKTSFAELIKRLEAHFGSQENNQSIKKDLGQYDVTVVGAGPAGVSAAIYSARKGLKTVVIAERVGGQLQDTKGIENFISTQYVEGPQLSDQLAKHMLQYDIQVLEHRRVIHVENKPLKVLQLDSGETLQTKSLIIATGAKWRELGVSGEKEYLGQGVAFCPHCDGPYYKGKDIAVVGGGNSGVEAAIDLAGIVKSIKLIEFAPHLKADQVLVDKLESLSNVSIIKNARITEVLGDGSKVTAVQYEDRESNSVEKIELDGVFVQIGLIPNSNFIKDIVATNQFGEIIVDEKCRTNISGIYAAGDVTTVPYKQIVISSGEGAKAALASFEDQMIS